MPHFRKKMQQLQGQPVKFTFVSLDNQVDWESTVPEFAAEHGITKNVILVDNTTLEESFFAQFKNWTGESIPFTYMRKGHQSDETIGMMTEAELDRKLSLFLSPKEELESEGKAN